MKPITLSPAQLDAALAVAPVRHLSPLQVDHVRNVLTVTGGAARAGKTAAMPPTVTRTSKPRRGRAR